MAVLLYDSETMKWGKPHIYCEVIAEHIEQAKFYWMKEMITSFWNLFYTNVEKTIFGFRKSYEHVFCLNYKSNLNLISEFNWKSVWIEMNLIFC